MIEPFNPPENWPLDPNDAQLCDSGLCKCDQADELYRRMRAAGLPAEAAEQACQATRAILTSIKQTFFPHNP